MVQIILLLYTAAFSNWICSPIKLMTSLRSVQSIKHRCNGFTQTVFTYSLIHPPPTHAHVYPYVFFPKFKSWIEVKY